MKIIKFRAWDNTLELMVYDITVMEFFKSKLIYIRNDRWQTDKNTINGIILMQYTGLKDSKSKEIYEGDIMVNPYDKKPMGFVKFMAHGVFAIKRPKGTTWHNISVHGGKKPKDAWISFYEVIGNIYENKELLCVK